MKGELMNGHLRKVAWCMLLDIQPSEMLTKQYVHCLSLEPKPENEKFMDQIILDVKRTFPDMPQMQAASVNENPLFRVLFAYSKFNRNLKYSQGMNFFAFVILVGVDFDETLAFAIFLRLLSAEGFYQMYADNFPLLFQVS